MQIDLMSCFVTESIMDMLCVSSRINRSTLFRIKNTLDAKENCSSNYHSLKRETEDLVYYEMHDSAKKRAADLFCFHNENGKINIYQHLSP